MASNGYVRADCFGCLFYSSDREYGDTCSLRREMFESDGMRWVSANDCDRDPEIKKKHYDKCEHRTSENDIKNKVREHFGFAKWDYNY